MANALKLEPVAVNFSLKDHTHDVLRDAILEMNIYGTDTAPRLDERDLAKQLGVSRTPVREALVRLQQDGFVEIHPRKGVFVRRKSRDEVLDMIVVWAALESMAARLVTERASDQELASLRKLALAKAADESPAEISAYSEANLKFHQRILTLSQCKLIKETADGLFLHMRAIRRRAMAEDNRSSHSSGEHKSIVEALEARDPDLASRRVREHTMRLHDHVKRTWTNLDAPERMSSANEAAAPKARAAKMRLGR